VLAGGDSAVGPRESALDGFPGVVDDERDLISGTSAVGKLNPSLGGFCLRGSVDVVAELNKIVGRVRVDLGVVVGNVSHGLNRVKSREVLPLVLGVFETTSGQSLPVAVR